MLGSRVLDVALGLVFVYLLLSLVCSALKEIIEVWLKKRAIDLERGIRELLNDLEGTGLAKKLYDHPLVCSLYKGTYDPSRWSLSLHLLGTRLPSYIPARNFALALMDVVLKADQNIPSGATDATVPPDKVGAAVVKPPVPFREAVGKIDNPQVKQLLLTLTDAAGGEMELVRKNIEAWFDSGMDRVAGWYRRWTQVVILLLGLAVTVALNGDTLAICTSLSEDQTVRDRLVASAQQYADKKQEASTNSDAKDPRTELRRSLNEVGALGLPLGWNENDPRTRATGRDPTQWLVKIAGWLLTTVAISLGAPFWFDLLNRFVEVRSAVKPHEKSPEEKTAG